jgi:hypothetical protein
MASAVSLDASWTAFFEAAALGESGLNTLAARGITKGAPPWAVVYTDAGEASAAAQAYDRNSERYDACTTSVEERDRYRFGSGGLWALLAPNALAAFWGTEYQCLEPWAIFDPPRAFVMIIELTRRVMKYSKFQQVPTLGNARVGHRATSLLGKPDELERQRTGHNKLGDRLVELGHSRSLVDQPVTPLPARDPLGMLAKLQAIA